MRKGSNDVNCYSLVQRVEHNWEGLATVLSTINSLQMGFRKMVSVFFLSFLNDLEN